MKIKVHVELITDWDEATTIEACEFDRPNEVRICWRRCVVRSSTVNSPIGSANGRGRKQHFILS